ncbi:MAG: hypothetical protein ACO1NO_06000 [Burkholderiaceae bacterium]
MAQPMTRLANSARWHCAVLRVFGLLAFGVLASVASAENLPDPTRPTWAGYADDNAENAYSGPVLQSVLTSSGRKLAIINGQTVKQGDMIGNARVAKIGDAEVVLAEGREMQVLKLFPVVEKQPSPARPMAKNGMRQ